MTDPVAALNLVLLFHSASPWDFDKQQKWQQLCHQLLGRPKFDTGWDATTKTLCDAVRATLAKVQ